VGQTADWWAEWDGNKDVTEASAGILQAVLQEAMLA
jgi:hypothetical protein